MSAPFVAPTRPSRPAAPAAAAAPAGLAPGAAAPAGLAPGAPAAPAAGTRAEATAAAATACAPGPAAAASGATPMRLTPRGRRLARLGKVAKIVGAPLLVAALVTAGSPGWGLYTIRSGDTLSEIAARYDTTVARLVKVNRLPGNGNLIYAGESIKVPGASGGSGSGGGRSHLVVRGDTLSGIAARYGVSQTALASANGIGRDNVVLLGATLRIPGGGRSSGGSTASGSTASSSNTFAGRTYSDSVVNAAAANRDRLAGRNVPSRERMRDIIAAKARANGVDPALALAVSYQESGWNQGVVSVANAVGAMQVIPTTTDWISGVVGRRLDPLKAEDNATTGVVLLKILTQAASNERQAVAAYYQGLKSVRENGMYSDTKRYVANVMALKRQFG
jgi:LysM repeat protein